jgi:hypothetical protein
LQKQIVFLSNEKQNLVEKLNEILKENEEKEDVITKLSEENVFYIFFFISFIFSEKFAKPDF